MDTRPVVRHPPWCRATIVVIVGLAAGWMSGVGFAWVLQAGGDWNAGLEWERALLLRMDPAQPAAFDWVMLVLPWLGTNLTIAPMIVAASVWLVWKRGRLDLAAHLCTVVAGSLTMNASLKALFDRSRPDLWAPRGQYDWAAYPSGHAIVGVAVIFTIAILLHRERGWHWPYWVAAALLIVNIYSRLYLGVHWPSDVIGGLLVGVVWLAATLYAFLGGRVTTGRPVPAEWGSESALQDTGEPDRPRATGTI